MSKRIMISVGGTGGHIYPAVALAQQIGEKNPNTDIRFIGGHLAKNRFFKKTSLSFENISCGSFVNKNPLKILSSLSSNGKGLYQSLKAIKKFSPHLIIGFGSYHSLPPMMAAWLCGIPILLYASDSHPGKVIRLFSRFSMTTAIQFSEAAAFLKGNTKIVKMPLRKELEKGLVSTNEAKKYFHLDENLLTLLVFGGSQGAAAINNLVCDTIKKNGTKWVHKIQFIHFTGREDFLAELQDAYKKSGLRSCVKVFEENMALAWEAADLVLSRAGAASIAEQIEFEKPTILIPYPHAADNHQHKNAHFMKYQIGAAELLLESEMNVKKLTELMEGFLKNNCQKLHQMRAAVSDFKQQRQAADLRDLVLDFL